MSDRDLWKEVTTWLADATRTAVKETEELARKGRIKLEIYRANKDIKENFSELGGVIYSLIQAESRSIKTNPKVKEIVTKIRDLEAKLDELKREEGEQKEEKASGKETGDTKKK